MIDEPRGRARCPAMAETVAQPLVAPGAEIRVDVALPRLRQLIDHVLGLQPSSPGFAAMTIEPHLGDLEWAEGSIATPHGPVWVRHEQGQTAVRTHLLEKPEGVRILD